MLRWMDLAQKLAPLTTIQSGPPAHVHDVRFDDGADGDVWVYINAHPDPSRREKQRFICVVARSDEAIAAELASHEAELAAWTEAAKAEAKAFVQRGLDHLLEQRSATSATHVQAMENATGQAQIVLDLAAKVDNLRATIEPLRSEGKPEVRAQVALLDLELGRMVDTLDATRRSAGEHRDRAVEFGLEVEAAEQRLARAEAELETEVSARFNKRVPPPPITDRIAELRAQFGRIAVHASEHPHKRMHVDPGAVTEIVKTHADWMRAGAGLAELTGR
jgi:hypothetical protein